MFFKLFICLAFILLTATAEPPVQHRAPYAANGWRPQKPFHLPGEYLPPTEIAQQRQPPVEFEIRKARVDYIGQVQQKSRYETPQKQQELPHETFTQFFPSTAQQQPRKPAQKYGPPQSVNFNIIYPDPRSLEESSFASGGGDIADFGNVETNRQTAPKDFDAENPTNARQGQYFVLGPDNTVQRVIFTTTQDEEERRTNGFTAQLKYTPVGELKDPVFRYNNKGQLIRVLKKK